MTAEPNGNGNGETPLSVDQSRNLKNVPKLVMDIPPKGTWQDYSVWRVNVYKSSLLIYYFGKQDGIITLGSSNLRNVLSSIENDVDTTQERAIYQFQVCDSTFISRTLNSRRGGQNEGIVPFRFIRANLKSKTFLLYQNSFTVKPNSYELDSLSQSIAIKCSYTQIMNPYQHISTPSLTVKLREEISFDNDVDD